MAGWTKTLPIDPLPSLQAESDSPLGYFVMRDLMDEPVGPLEVLWSGEPIPPDRDRPFSHMATGMVLRAFA